MEDIYSYEEFDKYWDEVGDYVDTHSGWRACKKRVLEILKENTKEREMAHGTGYEYISIDVIEEIEKL